MSVTDDLVYSVEEVHRIIFIISGGDLKVTTDQEGMKPRNWYYAVQFAITNAILQKKVKNID